MDTLFSKSAPKPLAEQLRPARISEIIGQDHLFGETGPIGRMIKAKRLSSIILWGPPGTGKTTIARLIANEVGLEFEQLSAVMSGVAELRKVMEAAKQRRLSGRGTLLFLDEIHRWSSSQQDALLPYVEDGTVTLIGATTENPSFALNSAIISRATVLTLNRFGPEALEMLIARAEQYMGRPLPVTEEARRAIIEMADGDGRYLIGLCEQIFDLGIQPNPLDVQAVATTLQKRAPAYDKSGDAKYGLLSALQKSIRGSDVQAALYYLARILKAGEDPRVILRRLVVMATEEIGMADPNALQQANAASQAYERLGTPEGLPAIGALVIYLATAPKSNAAYQAFYAAMEFADRTGSVPPPKHIINAPTKMMKDMGFKDGYKYDHDFPHSFSGQEFMPDGLDGINRPTFYHPKEVAHEREIIKRLKFWDDLKAKIGR